MRHAHILLLAAVLALPFPARAAPQDLDEIPSIGTGKTAVKPLAPERKADSDEEMLRRLLKNDDRAEAERKAEQPVRPLAPASAPQPPLPRLPSRAENDDLVLSSTSDGPHPAGATLKAKPAKPAKERTAGQDLVHLGDNAADRVAGTLVAPPTKGLVVFFLLLFAVSLALLLWWWNRHVKNKLRDAGIPVSILGQTHLDGETRIVLLKVGAKVIVLAKSRNFCTALDTITEPDEVNLLTLGSSPERTDSGFRKVMNDLRSRGRAPAQDTEAARMREELDQLKKQLKGMG